MKEDYYDILGISKSASESEIKKILDLTLDTKSIVIIDEAYFQFYGKSLYKFFYK